MPRPPHRRSPRSPHHRQPSQMVHKYCSPGKPPTQHPIDLPIGRDGQCLRLDERKPDGNNALHNHGDQFRRFGHCASERDRQCPDPRTDDHLVHRITDNHHKWSTSIALLANHQRSIRIDLPIGRDGQCLRLDERKPDGNNALHDHGDQFRRFGHCASERDRQCPDPRTDDHLVHRITDNHHEWFTSIALLANHQRSIRIDLPIGRDGQCLRLDERKPDGNNALHDHGDQFRRFGHCASERDRQCPDPRTDDHLVHRITDNHHEWLTSIALLANHQRSIRIDLPIGRDGQCLRLDERKPDGNNALHDHGDQFRRFGHCASERDRQCPDNACAFNPRTDDHFVCSNAIGTHLWSKCASFLANGQRIINNTQSRKYQPRREWT